MRGAQAIFTSGSDEWETPQLIYDLLNEEFHFTLDPCATDDNHKCEKYYTMNDDGLSRNWGGADRVLQSAVLGNFRLGRKGLPGKPDGSYSCRASHSGADGHEVFPQLHLPAGGDPFYPWAAEVQ